MSEEKALIMAVPVADAVGIFKSLIGGQDRGRGGQERGERRRGQGQGRGRGRGRGQVRDGRVSKGQRNQNHNHQTKLTKLQVPILNGFQLIGDSIASRLTPSCSPPLQAEYNHFLKSKQVGFIVHGQTTCQLARHLNQATFNWADTKAAVLIGTNDVMKDVPLEDTHKGLKNIISHLAMNCKTVLIMTIPPIPRKSEYSVKVEKLNELIVKEAAKKDNVHVLDLHAKYLKMDDSVDLDLFEKTFKSGMVDLIHPNANGIECMKNALIEVTAKLSLSS